MFKELANRFHTHSTVPVCVGFIAAVRVGRALGANKPRAAKSAYLSALSLGLLAATIISLTLVWLRAELPLFFSKDPKVTDQVTMLMPLVALISAIDNAAITSTGTLRGMGRQYFSATTNILGLVVCGLGSATVMVLYLHWGLWGIWLGLLAGVCIVTGSQVAYLSFIVGFAEWLGSLTRGGGLQMFDTD
jgi:MATE family multidrug resistance protein